MMRVVGPDVANRFSAHPDIAADIGGPLDFTGAVQCIHIYGEHGGFTFDPTGPNEYEVHAMFTKAGRGKWAARAAQETLALLGADRIWARVDTPRLAQFTCRAGFTEIETHLPGYRIFEWRKPCPLQSSAA